LLLIHKSSAKITIFLQTRKKKSSFFNNIRNPTWFYWRMSSATRVKGYHVRAVAEE